MYSQLLKIESKTCFMSTGFETELFEKPYGKCSSKFELNRSTRRPIMCHMCKYT